MTYEALYVRRSDALFIGQDLVEDLAQERRLTIGEPIETM